MSPTSSPTRQCPHCGEINDSDNAYCINCNTPFTAYSGQLDGEVYEGKLAQQAALLNTRPVAVTAMSLFLILFALFWPILGLVHLYHTFIPTNASGTNYIVSAVSSIVPVLTTFVLIPIALALFYIAWATWSQASWTWLVDALILGICAVCCLLSLLTFKSIFFLILTTALAFLWFRRETKAWFGYF
ncbi:MAG TPA: zinc ribbon domain-containing protein [Chthonomonadaceae bacterium]|nr:zinc ribbon domain-containing protein [Chthonomonadaceae bacterium]